MRPSAPPEPFVVHRDRHLLIVHKPSGLPSTAPDRGPSLTAWAERAVGTRLHPTSRLDAEVTGMVTFTRTPAAAKRLVQARREGRYGRGYLALVAGVPAEAAGAWSRSIAIDPRDPRLRIAVDPGASGARVQVAKSGYTVRATVHAGAGEVSALYLRPHTGRTHQLRVHCADAGSPIVGDVRYGGPRRLVLADGRVLSAPRTMLHCTYLRLPSIEDGDERVFTSPPPEDFTTLWSKLGGDAAALASEPDPA